MRQCAWCHNPLDDTKLRRKDAVTCSNRCRKALSRDSKRRGSSSYTQAGSVPTGDVPYLEPPSLGETGSYAAWRSGERFRTQLADHAVMSQPLTDDEQHLLKLQRANPGVLLEPIRQRQIEREFERMRRGAVEYASHQLLKVETPLDPSSHGSLARRAMQSRAINRPVDPQRFILRPGRRSGPHPWDDEPECITAPWSRGRW